MINEEKIFKFIRPHDNDMISNFVGFDLSYFFELLNNYYIDYRYYLGFDKLVTFGFEIESESANKKKINYELDKEFKDDLWYFDRDDTVYNGGEISTPILTDLTDNWLNIEKACNILNKYSRVGESCGGHIHIGSQVLGDEPISWINFIKLWVIYEKIIYRFGSGEYLINRHEISKFAPPMAQKLYNSYNYISNMRTVTLKRIIDLIDYKKFSAINFLHVKSNHINKIEEMNTIEFRTPNGTLNPIIWQNNLNMFIHLLKYARSEEFNHDFIDEKFSNIYGLKPNIQEYQKIFISDALEFTDLIFDNNLNKINFLKQYFKNFKMCTDNVYDEEKVVLTRKL